MKLTMFFARLVAIGAAGAIAAPDAPVARRQAGPTFTGVNVAGGEFGNMNLPGQLNRDYVWPDKSALDTLMGHGMNTFRVAMMMSVVSKPLPPSSPSLTSPTQHG